MREREREIDRETERQRERGTETERAKHELLKIVVYRTTLDKYKFGTDPTMEDQIRRTNNWIYKTKRSNLDRPSGPVGQRIEALSLYGSR